MRENKVPEQCWTLWIVWPQNCFFWVKSGNPFLEEFSFDPRGNVSFHEFLFPFIAAHKLKYYRGQIHQTFPNFLLWGESGFIFKWQSFSHAKNVFNSVKATKLRSLGWPTGRERRWRVSFTAASGVNSHTDRFRHHWILTQSPRVERALFLLVETHHN